MAIVRESDESQKTDEQLKGKEEPKKAFLTIDLKGKDPQTGKDFDQTKALTEEEAKDYVRLGYRAQAKLGAFNAEVGKQAMVLAKEIAGQMAGPMARDEAMKILAEMNKQAPPELKPPTYEEIQQNPNALVEFMNKRDQALRAEFHDKIDKTEKDRTETDTMLLRAKVEIDQACKDFPLLTRKTLIKVIRADETPVGAIHDKAQELSDELTGSLDGYLKLLPEDQRAPMIERYLEATKAPAPPPSGTTNKETTPPMSFKELKDRMDKGEY